MRYRQCVRAFSAVSIFLCLSALAQGPSTTTASKTETQSKTLAAPSHDVILIPGPLRSFLRMAGISQKVDPDDVLPLLARNVYLRGYEDGIETEFLRLLDRYVHQARELEALAGPDGTIHTANCQQASQLLQVLGYQLHGACGQRSSYLMTANPERAFLTIDSGFPLTQLEQSLQKNLPFSYAYPVERVPVIFHESDWAGITPWRKKGVTDLIEVLIHDPDVARLYSALSKNDEETREALRRSPGLKKLLPYAAVLDFYGSQIAIRSGRVVVPGGNSAEQGWKDLVGASPQSYGDFVSHLVARDKGWLAVYYDVLARIPVEQQARLTEPTRLRRLYEAYRSSGPDPSATKGVFRKGSDLLILYSRLPWTLDGQPYVPGNLEIWREVLEQKADSKFTHEWAHRSRNWNNPEQLLEALVAFSRLETETGPVQIYLTLSEIDKRRGPDKRLSDGAVRMIAAKYNQYKSWYAVFAEFPGLNDTSIFDFVNVAEAMNKIPNPSLRANTLGAFQANTGLWQILARQGEIPSSQMSSSWQSVVEPFAKITNSVQLFDAARSSVNGLMLAVTGSANWSQDDLVEMLAGPPQPTSDRQRVRDAIATKIHTVLDDQRLASLDTLFALGDGLDQMAKGKGDNDRMLALANQLKDFELPRPIFTKSEKIEWSPVVYSSRHAELQAKTDLAKLIKTSASPAQLEAARGQLAPFLRDTLVGLNYAYYEPPGAQILHNNPLFVRSHDFAGITIIGAEQLWGPPDLIGIGTPAGGGAYLMGSLADLPYALATVEEDFISPENVQALIWKEMVPDLLVNATLARWWRVDQNELHAVALYQRSGEEILRAAASDPALRSKVLAIFSQRMSPQRLEQVDMALQRPEALDTLRPPLLPADSFYLAAGFRKDFPAQFASFGPASRELNELCSKDPVDTEIEKISEDFGVPHPTLTHNYTRELLNEKPFPVFGGYSYRLFGESWESSNLYWARLADEMGYSPAMLNQLVPELTTRMVAKIFATDLDDWPAIARAMQEAGAEFRQKKDSTLQAVNSTLSQEPAR
jgi:hypothetical protein